VLTHILPSPFDPPHVGGVASNGFVDDNLVVITHSSAVTDVTLYNTSF
jgi:hypothetical protein